MKRIPNRMEREAHARELAAHPERAAELFRNTGLGLMAIIGEANRLATLERLVALPPRPATALAPRLLSHQP